MTFLGWHLVNRFNLATDAVDHDAACAVITHQELVVRLLDARLANDSAAPQPLVGGLAQLEMGNLAHMAEQMRRQRMLVG